MWHKKITLIFFLSFPVCPHPALAELTLAENDKYSFSMDTILRTDVIALNNNLDLDNKGKDDDSVYLGIDYSFGFDFQMKQDGPEIYFKLQRSGPFGYNAPLFIHNTLKTSIARVEKYQGEELLPQLKEYWFDIPVGDLPLRWKGGTFGYSVGHGLAIGTFYENYGMTFYDEKSNVPWRFHYFFPDLYNDRPIGPSIAQQNDQLIDYNRSKAHLFALDTTFQTEKQSWQPYIGVLYDRTNGKRANSFATPTHHDTLGTFGLSWDLTTEKWAAGLEGSRNFGQANSSDDDLEDVRHTGYAFYGSVSYKAGTFKPRSHFIFASGNEVTTDMVDSGHTVMTNGKNKAFSVISPLNTNLFDAITQPSLVGPLLAMGKGWGLNYGINRPTTFLDAGLFENIILPSIGFEQQLTDKLTLAMDLWFLRSQQRGVGTFDGAAKELSYDLGKELDVYFDYALNSRARLNLAAGYFWPGKFYKEERDDTTGSLFTPFIRGDGEADPAYQIELSLELSF